MPKEYPRTARVAEQVRRELSELVRNEVKDPRLGPVTITEVRVSKDLSHAKVYVSFLGKTEGQAERLAILSAAAGFLRGLLGRRLSTRTVPSLHFFYDDILDQGQHMDRLIEMARAKDVDHQDGDH